MRDCNARVKMARIMVIDRIRQTMSMIRIPSPLNKRSRLSMKLAEPFARIESVRKRFQEIHHPFVEEIFQLVAEQHFFHCAEQHGVQVEQRRGDPP